MAVYSLPVGAVPIVSVAALAISGGMANASLNISSMRRPLTSRISR
jgi:hypothetical protein